MLWRQKALVIETRILCGGCREEDSPITIWKEGFKRKEWTASSSVCRANRKNGPSLCLLQQFGGYVRVTLANVCGMARQGNLTGKTRRLAAEIRPVNGKWVVIMTRARETARCPVCVSESNGWKDERPIRFR